MAGLATAHVLGKHFDQVYVLEKDSHDSAWRHDAVEVAKSKAARRGVPQYNMLHVFVSQGLQTMDRLFDGQFISAMQQSGAVMADAVTNFRFIHPAGGIWQQPHQPSKGPLIKALATRHLTEKVARQLLEADDNVEVMYGAQVSGLVVQGGPNHEAAVTGVQLSCGRQIGADLVVDCCGRQSRMPDWLEAVGFKRPRVSVVNADLGYASWLVKLDPAQEALLDGQGGLYVMAAYPQPAGGALTRVEDGLYVAGAISYGSPTLPFADGQLLHYVNKSVWHPALHAVLSGSTQVAPASRFYKVRSTWHHYEEVALPEGVLVMADSLCSFNPIYGHGMTVAAMEAAQLDELLSQRKGSSSSLGAAVAVGKGSSWLKDLSREFQMAIHPLIQNVWDLCVAGDLRFAGTTSTDPPPPFSGILNSYMDTLMAAAAQDSEVTEAFLRVMHLVDPPAQLFQPAILGRVVMHAVRKWFA